MQLRAMAIARWLLPVPVPPTSTALRFSTRNAPVARSRTRPSLTGVPAKSNWPRSLASGTRAMVSWYLIERACFSAISARSRSPTIRWTGCWRFSPSAITSSKAARMPPSFSSVIICRTSWRSIWRTPQTVIPGAIGSRFVLKAQGGGGEDRFRCDGFPAAGQDVEDDGAGLDAIAQRLAAGRFHGGQTVRQHRAENVHHLAVGVGRGGEPGAHPPQGARQNPVPERRPVPESSWLAGQDGHVVPGIVDGLVAAEPAGMLGDDLAVLADHDAVGIGLDFDGPTDRPGRDRVLVVVEAHQAGLRDRRRRAVEAIEPAGIGHQRGALGLEHRPHRLVPHLGMAMGLGMGDAAVEQPGVHLLVAREPQTRREEALAHQTDLVLDLPLLPARRRRAGFDQIMAAHLEKAPVEPALLADEHGVDLHVVVDAACAGAAEKGEAAVMSVEHHLLARA